MNYHGVEFENRAEVLRRYFINSNSSISAVMRKYDISESDALDYTILRRKYSLEYYGYYKDSFYKCKCKNCFKSFIFTVDLALDHIIECKYKEKCWRKLTHLFIDDCGLYDEFKEYRLAHCAHCHGIDCLNSIINDFMKLCESSGKFNLEYDGSIYTSVNDFLADYEYDVEIDKFVRKA